jgi:hypothetical protein
LHRKELIKLTEKGSSLNKIEFSLGKNILIIHR